MRAGGGMPCTPSLSDDGQQIGTHVEREFFIPRKLRSMRGAVASPYYGRPILQKCLQSTRNQATET